MNKKGAHTNVNTVGSPTFPNPHWPTTSRPSISRTTQTLSKEGEVVLEKMYFLILYFISQLLQGNQRKMCRNLNCFSLKKKEENWKERQPTSMNNVSKPCPNYTMISKTRFWRYSTSKSIPSSKNWRTNLWTMEQGKKLSVTRFSLGTAASTSPRPTKSTSISLWNSWHFSESASTISNKGTILVTTPRQTQLMAYLTSAMNSSLNSWRTMTTSTWKQLN